MRHIWLLDIDGVLVRARGYRAAMRAAINHFSRRLGLGDRAPSDAEVDLFEACGLINEWDSVPMCVSALVLEAWRAAPDLHVSADVERTIAAILAAGQDDLQADYRALARRIAVAREAGEAPSKTALRLLTADAATAGRSAEALESFTAAMHVLLGDTDNVETSPTTYVFQQFSLGSRLFEKTFRRVPDFDTGSLLAEHDIPGLGPAWRDRLLGHLERGELRASVFTARPSGVPREVGDLWSLAHGPNGSLPPGAYAPEAEIATQMVGLGGLPLIGYGRIQWLAARAGQEVETLVKPSPVHALAAIGAAISGREADSLTAAYNLVTTGRLASPLTDLQGGAVTISVFEDTFGGIRAVRQAAALLAAQGIEATAEVYGIAAGNADKIVALEAESAPIFEDLETALELACQRAGLCG